MLSCSKLEHDDMASEQTSAARTPLKPSLPKAPSSPAQPSPPSGGPPLHDDGLESLRDSNT